LDSFDSIVLPFALTVSRRHTQSIPSPFLALVCCGL
jgi:hypothetical protein